ncbi:hypothetical protein FNV43_RR18061 [Rhamnella rubrinervis]|uniref:Uncharacterized protein n=1 Tax=Rhamnella rubrinervis TaxID=2594499 RepID=A0A8K0GW63_9ROSA|nr:hypothetical protein FNV43_RR18061 [Rhamnella rubrinervis]
MGEVVASGEQVVEVEVEMREAEKSEESNKMEKEEEDGGSKEVVRWESYLPRMALTVLLVEADDSTRQIIAALLRKCNYKVSAVPNGLKAWETLKEKPHNIDLILTEVELPAISGFALLSLVMEHDVCKNIPVIMMSSQHSISMVLKCMLKGAADYLIKPVRRNELRNLWQHVWRRHYLLSGQAPQNLPIPQPKVEATSENNTASNHSSDDVVSMQQTEECSEKGSDAQSSCTTPYLEAESACIQNMQDISRLNCGNASYLSKSGIGTHEECTKPNKVSFTHEVEKREDSRYRPEGTPCNGVFKSIVSRLESKTVAQDEGVQPESVTVDANVSTETQRCHDEMVEPPCGVIDLIGKFDNRPMHINRCSSNNADGPNNFECAPQLELSLRRICPSSSNNLGTGERPVLNHSNASAFSWYNNSKTLQPLIPVLTSNCAKSEDGASKSQELSFSQSFENSTGASQQRGGITNNCHENMAPSVVNQSGQTKSPFPSPQPGLIPITGVRFDNLSSGNGQLYPSFFYTQQSLSSILSPKSSCLREKSPFSTSIHSNHDTHNSEHGCHRFEENTNYSTDQDEPEQNNLDRMEELTPGSPADDQSASGNLCNGAAYDINSAADTVDNRSDGNATLGMAVGKAIAPYSVTDTSLLVHERIRGMDSLRSSQREAALTKFRLKRKDRCFEKKVRYQSRKKLAEQRPRVKGQFVRQAQTDSQVMDADG